MDISEELKQEAVKDGLCEKWTGEWHDETLDTLCEKYIKGIDFCILNDYPSVEYMKSHFNGIMQKHGIYVDDKVEERNLRTAVFNGISIGSVSYDKFSVGRIYLRHNSVLSIHANEYSKVFISMYGHSLLNIECSPFAKVYVSCYGGQINSKEQKNI